jgi:hypothetical protein
MCLDPRPDRLYRTVRADRRPTSSRVPGFRASAVSLGLPVAPPAPVIRAPAVWALDRLAGDDELVARGWVVLSRGE